MGAVCVLGVHYSKPIYLQVYCLRAYVPLGRAVDLSSVNVS